MSNLAQPSFHAARSICSAVACAVLGGCASKPPVIPPLQPSPLSQMEQSGVTQLPAFFQGDGKTPDGTHVTLRCAYAFSPDGKTTYSDEEYRDVTYTTLKGNMTRYVGIADWVIKITGQKLPKALQDTPVRRDLMAVIENESGDFVVHGKCVMNPETYKASDCQRKPPLKGKEASQIKAQAVYEDGLAFESCRGLIGAYELVRHANPARRDSRKIEHLKLTFDRIVRRLTGQLSVPDRSKPAMDPNQAQGYLPH